MRYGEFVDQEIDRLIAEAEKQIPTIPADLDRNYEAAGGWTGLTAGAALGGKVGAGLGIAGGPLGAIAGTIPGLIIGGDHRLFWWLKGWRTNLRRTLIGASIVKNSDKLEKVVALTATLDGTDLFPSKKVKVFTDTVDLKEIGEFLAEFG